MNEEAQQTTAVAAAPRAVRPIDSVRAAFEKMRPQFEMVLPKHLTAERLVRVALTACQQTPKLLDCDRQSLYAAVMRAATLGLEPDGVLGQAYLIPFGGKVQFIPGYRGLIDLARRSGEVSNMIAREVCKNDEFTVDFSQEVPFTHKPKLEGDRGEVTHFWALARFKDGGFHWDYLTRQEVETIRNQSAGWQTAVKYGKQADSPWQKHFIEMGKKTAIRRIAKYLPMSVQKAALLNDLVDAGKKFDHNEYGEIVIDESSTIEGEVAETKGNDAVKNKLKKKAKAAGADPETGEIKEREPQPETEAEPPVMHTIDEAKQAGAILLAELEESPSAIRSEIFMRHFGSDIVDALRIHGQGLMIGKIKNLGISLPEAA